MKIIYLGTPDFAIRPLEKLINSGYEITAVITQPDRPKGRKGEIVFPPLKDFALKNGLKVLQFEKIKNNAEDIKNLNADIMITCAYGQLLTKQIIDICPYGIINIHASLLPLYRGAAPIQWAVINGEKKTGVTIMQTDEGLDTGDIILAKEIDIKPCETSGELFERLSDTGAEAVLEALDLIKKGKAVKTKQNNDKATKVKTIKKQDALIDFDNSAENIFNFIRGMNPWPVAFTYYNGLMLKIYKAEVIDFENAENKAGEIISADSKSGLVVACKKGLLKISEIQAAGGKRMKASDFLRGKNLAVGDFLNKTHE